MLSGFHRNVNAFQIITGFGVISLCCMLHYITEIEKIVSPLTVK